MTPQEKARQLYEEYRFKFFGSLAYKTLAKQCALIAVNEIIAISSLTKIVYTESTNNSISEYTEHYYWQQVKEEINKL